MESSEKPILKLKLLVDRKTNKVVLAEAGKDFVDVLFGFMALPMGTIVRLLEKNSRNQKSQATRPATIGCFNNLYKSVVDMDEDDFMTEASKDMLLYPKFVKEKQCRQLKLYIGDDTEEFKVPDGVCDELFVSQKTSFHITETMEVAEFASIMIARRILLRLGYDSFKKLDIMSVDVGHEEVLSLLHCLFFSETPFTDVFLKKHSSCGMTRSHDMLTLPVEDGEGGKYFVTIPPTVYVEKQDQEDLYYAESRQAFRGSFLKKHSSCVEDEGEAGGPNEVVSLTIFVRRQDRKVLYAESGQDFVDLLFTFLAIPLESVWEITRMHCLQKSLLGVSYLNNDGSCQWTSHSNSGIVKRGATYMITDDLTITAANSCSTISLLEKLHTNLSYMEEHVINISKAEAINLLNASLVTSTPLTTTLSLLDEYEC
ncbi:uncharacterized protein LOC9328684 [Arabidopsis lyrata subsp. lyrata]|uniref:uncharacterized protein LOC9328684 n=1 Tax=Arabidopsis lyrata subsp. lyrata TaxID=81972 RepID=UPI000A29B2FD|nr:uncharacterized protein LOC9328684 [Arabidopsis lyrata subsp. lyrata]|eukprot:XP_020869194.1 uncharacterized protein LOC9328684 [Arabidopsis lyrata subsp. lyrata]